MNRLRELRIKKGLSLKEVSEKIGLAESQLSYYETEKRTPRNQETWQNLADFYDVPVPYLMGLNSNKDSENFFGVEKNKISIENRETLEAINQLVGTLLDENYGWAALQVQEIFKNLNNIIEWSNIVDADYSPIDVLASFSSLIRSINYGEFSQNEDMEKYFDVRSDAINKLDKLFAKKANN